MAAALSSSAVRDTPGEANISKLLRLINCTPQRRRAGFTLEKPLTVNNIISLVGGGVTVPRGKNKKEVKNMKKQELLNKLEKLTPRSA